MHNWRVQNDVASLHAAGEIDLEAGKGSAGQLAVGDASVDDRPEGLAIQRERPGRKGGERDHARDETEHPRTAQPFTPGRNGARRRSRRSTMSARFPSRIGRRMKDEPLSGALLIAGPRGGRQARAGFDNQGARSAQIKRITASNAS